TACTLANLYLAVLLARSRMAICAPAMLPAIRSGVLSSGLHRMLSPSPRARIRKHSIPPWLNGADLLRMPRKKGLCQSAASFLTPGAAPPTTLGCLDFFG